VAAHQKKAQNLHATLCFADESGYTLLPLIRTTQARIGRTPLLTHQAGRRAKVSLAAALTLSAGRGRVNLYYQDYVNDHFDTPGYAQFIRNLLWTVPGPVILLQDNGPTHSGEAFQRLQSDFPRLHVHPFPPSAPELNPPEHLFNYTKDKRLVNFAPRDAQHMDQVLVRLLEEIRQDQHRLQSFLDATSLPWNGLKRFS
jgi:putative transposase